MFKVAILGDKSVGKTSIVQRLTTNKFNADTATTLGANFASHVIQIKNDVTKQNVPVKL